MTIRSREHLVAALLATSLTQGHLFKRDASDTPSPSMNSSEIATTRITALVPPPPSAHPAASVDWSNPSGIYPIEPATWAKLKLDDYLANFPNGKNLSLADFAVSKNIQNFVCGIGESCDPGQPGMPILHPEWDIFYAVHNWNVVQNAVYSAIGVAMSMTQSITSALVADLYHPVKRSPLWKWNEIFAIAGGIAALVASVVIIWPGTLLAIGIWYAINAVIGVGSGALGMSIMKMVQKDNPDPFQRWAEFSWYLGQWQLLAQGTLSNMTDSITRAGISTPEGISGILKNGTYMQHISPKQFSEVETEVTFTATARVLTAIIQDYGGFVTVGDGCHGKGPNGAWDDPDSISFCYPNKTMLNVIRHKKNKVKNTFYHGRAINSTYGFSAEYLTTQSYNCQLKYGKPKANPYNQTAVPTDRNSDCVINLPVCDTRIPEIRKAIKKHGTVKACREVGKLPI